MKGWGKGSGVTPHLVYTDVYRHTTSRPSVYRVITTPSPIVPQGKWNGFGGKVEIGETIVEGAAREMAEESGLTVAGMIVVGMWFTGECGGYW